MYLSEDGFQVIPNYSFDEVCQSDYRCIILSGTNPIPVLYDKKTIDFLKGCKGKDLLIATISSSITGKSWIVVWKEIYCRYISGNVRTF